MANKRMFSRTVTDRDDFIALSLSAQALYFHLGLVADDDGFTRAVLSTMRKIGAGQDDVDELTESGLIYRFETGVYVIMDWYVHNTIKTDKYYPTQYQAEKKQLDGGKVVGDAKEGTPYVFKTNETGVPEGEPQYRTVEDSTGETSTGEDSISENRGAEGRKGGLGEKEPKDPYEQEFETLLSDYPNIGDRERAFAEYMEVRQIFDYDEISQGLTAYRQKVGAGYPFPQLWQWLNCGQWQ